MSGIKDSFSPLGVMAKKASSQITSLYFLRIISKDFLSHNCPVGLCGLVIQRTSQFVSIGKVWGKLLLQFFGNSE